MNAQASSRPRAAAGGALPWLLACWCLGLLVWWGMAFAPASPAAPWLKAAQVACFGTLDNGLPSAWGWAVLVLSPLSLLAGILAVYGRELAVLLAELPTRPLLLRWAAVFGVALLMLAGLVGLRVREGLAVSAIDFSSPEGQPWPQDQARLDLPLPDFKLVDQAGRTVGPQDLKGRVTLLTFAYAHCKTICPFLVRDTLKTVRSVPGTQAVFLTLDPWRDTPSALPTVAKGWGFGAESRLLTGEPAKVWALLKRLEVEVQRDEKTGMVDHPPLVMLVDAKGRLAYRFYNAPAAWLHDAALKLQREG